MDENAHRLLARYRAGDTQALGELVECFKRPLFAFILKMTEGKDEADDIFQEVWIRAIRNLHRFKAKNMLSWLFRIAHNLVIDRARKRKPDAHLQDAITGERTVEDTLAGSGQAPDADCGNRDLLLRINDAVGKLPEEQRVVFLMRMEADLSFKEIAHIQNTSINTALARMHYALAKLRTELADDYALLGRNTT